MRPPERFSRIIDGKRYDVRTATLLAGDDWWDGHNHERRGTNRFLYRTPRGRYFFVTLTQWQGSRDELEPVSEDAAIGFYESVPPDCQREYWQEAFPGRVVEEA